MEYNFKECKPNEIPEVLEELERPYYGEYKVEIVSIVPILLHKKPYHDAYETRLVNLIYKFVKQK